MRTRWCIPGGRACLSWWRRALGPGGAARWAACRNRTSPRFDGSVVLFDIVTTLERRQAPQRPRLLLCVVPLQDHAARPDRRSLPPRPGRQGCPACAALRTLGTFRCRYIPMLAVPAPWAILQTMACDRSSTLLDMWMAYDALTRQKGADRVATEKLLLLGLARLEQDQ